MNWKKLRQFITLFLFGQVCISLGTLVDKGVGIPAISFFFVLWAFVTTFVLD